MCCQFIDSIFIYYSVICCKIIPRWRVKRLEIMFWVLTCDFWGWRVGYNAINSYFLACICHCMKLNIKTLIHPLLCNFSLSKSCAALACFRLIFVFLPPRSPSDWVSLSKCRWRLSYSCTPLYHTFGETHHIWMNSDRYTFLGFFLSWVDINYK